MKTVKTITACVMLLVMLLSLCACGKAEEPAKTETPSGMESQLPGANLESGSDSSKTESTDQAGQVNYDAEKNKAAAKALIGEDVSKLYAVIGEPVSSSYASSCLGPGEDGELCYDGFTVYTYKDGTSEKIQDVD